MPRAGSFLQKAGTMPNMDDLPDVDEMREFNAVADEYMEKVRELARFVAQWQPSSSTRC